MKILQYRGVSLISKGIQWQTRSPYSHTAVLLDDEHSVIEAWHKGGVRRLANPFEGHDLKTVIDVYDVEGDYDADAVLEFLNSQMGKKYDFWAIGRFLTRRQHQANDKWFCSELAVEAFKRGGLELLRGKPSLLSPRDVALSPYLKRSGQLHVK